MKTLTRRHVLTSLSSAGAVLLCPTLLNAQDIDLSAWSDLPTTQPVGQTSLLELDAGPVEVDITTLQPGEVAVIARPSDSDIHSATDMIQYVAVLRRTEAQIAFGRQDDHDGTVQDVRYLVVDLVCPHRGKAVGVTGDEAVPFACTDRGSRHSSNFSASGQGVSGASDASDWLSVPRHSLDIQGEGSAISSAVLILA